MQKNTLITYADFYKLKDFCALQERWWSGREVRCISIRISLRYAQPECRAAGSPGHVSLLFLFWILFYSLLCTPGISWISPSVSFNGSFSISMSLGASFSVYSVFLPKNIVSPPPMVATVTHTCECWGATGSSSGDVGVFVPLLELATTGRKQLMASSLMGYPTTPHHTNSAGFAQYNGDPFYLPKHFHKMFSRIITVQ